mmetsp:Transcript_9717/g.24964  ORF Transcript_9717/g.24964 Transcript_9717/m.24964 type:complete len:136 (+) Transcript_9717:212-619(+)|eukprot:CAMPEP_0182925296 /NCGR_PEP_ID=MMETSP0105_2-20130417/9154_1 /TAXON_ID=81532 ORGANISM="Acanthoeca-like sp., Strain 10tr" /NCGR_SAMPLE_ID=MMETSP0105_2 /ASSEMBLY_ACC=CAM_ASM_000205 /LENGTH=135 /DNA_ID=CAMNT_0025063139 /DNA_START=210 /DNA_END=617 /DNA_ORIENTATION=+
MKATFATPSEFPALSAGVPVRKDRGKASEPVAGPVVVTAEPPSPAEAVDPVGPWHAPANEYGDQQYEEDFDDDEYDAYDYDEYDLYGDYSVAGGAAAKSRTNRGAAGGVSRRRIDGKGTCFSSKHVRRQVAIRNR